MFSCLPGHICGLSGLAWGWRPFFQTKLSSGRFAGGGKVEASAFIPGFLAAGRSKARSVG